DHTSLGFRGRFCPIRRPLFQGSRRGTDDWLLSSMIVSSEPTAPSRLRSDEGRQGILSPVVGLLLKATHSSSAASGSTPYGSGPSLWLTVIMTVRRPYKPLGGRGSLRSALIAASWCRSSAMMPPH